MMDELKKNSEEQPEVQPTEQYQNPQQSYNKVEKNLKIFPIWGDSSTYNINPLLRNNILNSQYFKDLYLLKTYHEVLLILDEIHNFFVKNIVKQVKGLLDYKGNTYVRCVGFLYVRFCCDPEYLWDWLSKYLLDDEELHPSADPKVVTTVGDYVESLITEMTYYQTRFPRIPVMIDRNLRAKVLLMREKRERKRINIENIHLFQKGVKVKALSSQDGEWHFGVVERVEGKNVRVRFILEDQGGFSFKSNTVFYSGEEYVNFADIYILSEEDEEEERMRNAKPLEDKQFDKNEQRNRDSHDKDKNKRNRDSSDDSSRSSSKGRRHKKSKHKHHKHHHHHKRHHHKRSASSSNSKSRSRSRSKSHNRSPSKKSKQQKNEKTTKIMTEEEKYLEEVLRREKNGALANCKADYSKRPTSYKTSLSNPLPSGSTRTRSRSPSPIKKKEMFVETSAPKYEENKEIVVKKITLSQEYILRMKKLKETYGDASANASLLKNLTQKKAVAHHPKVTNAMSENSMGLEDVLKLGN